MLIQIGHSCGSSCFHLLTCVTPGTVWFIVLFGEIKPATATL